MGSRRGRLAIFQGVLQVGVTKLYLVWDKTPHRYCMYAECADNTAFVVRPENKKELTNISDACNTHVKAKIEPWKDR